MSKTFLSLFNSNNNKTQVHIKISVLYDFIKGHLQYLYWQVNACIRDSLKANIRFIPTTRS